MSLLLITSDRFRTHLTPPGHPESVERAEVMARAAESFRAAGGTMVEPRPATLGELARVHDRGHIDAIAAVAGRATMIDTDTFTSPASFDVARLAAGAACQGVEEALAHDGPVCCFVRPPGHHAERERAMGFCLFNSVAVAAAHARAQGIEKVAIVDFDVHHGNGTQGMFYDDPHVLYVSTHQFPFYPGTGAAGEVGRGNGIGFTVNLPLEAGAVDADYAAVWSAVVDPVLRDFEPELLLVSAGFDAHARDPLAYMRMSTEGYGSLIAALWHRALESCSGRLVAVTEGGYDLDALGACLEALLSIVGDPSAAAPWRPDADVAGAPRGAATVAAVLAAQRRHWPGL
jgi:acetoin utilization deacetylase AcuC-like enzyme